MKANSFETYVLEQLACLADLRRKAMFGGQGLYLGNRFFAILHRGRLYFKTDARTREGYLRAGSEPFRPNPRQTLGSYYEVPAAVLEDVSTLQAWALSAAAIDA